jgi:hypothetical protein
MTEQQTACKGLGSLLRRHTMRCAPLHSRLRPRCCGETGLTVLRDSISSRDIRLRDGQLVGLESSSNTCSRERARELAQ